MKLNEAVRKRIYYYCNEQKISINELANRSLLTQSTLNNVINLHIKSCGLQTISKICYGLKIELKDFFDDDMFRNLDMED